MFLILIVFLEGVKYGILLGLYGLQCLIEEIGAIIDEILLNESVKLILNNG
jgi:hypothetical protein